MIDIERSAYSAERPQRDFATSRRGSRRAIASARPAAALRIGRALLLVRASASFSRASSASRCRFHMLA